MVSKSLAQASLAALVIAMNSVPAIADDKAFGGPHSLVGSWEFTLKPHDCVSGAEAPPQFWNFSYLTFNAGGTLHESTSNPRFQPGQRGPGHGHFERIGPKTYDAVLQAFIQFDTVPPAVPSYVRGSVRITQVIEMLDANHWQSVADVDFRDGAGNPISRGCANAVATRMP
ncbi:MAG TPA: hypothetical protein VJ891_11510 [Casimicrobiaceae bacterium]|nr:hypothetical protein [Casimicrobiaceae bacterium]